MAGDYNACVDSQMREQFRAAVYNAAGRAEVRDAVQQVYRLLQEQIDLRRPKCSASGRCCRFEQFGHRLYVTTIELAAFVYELETRSWAAELDEARRQWGGAGCPFQGGGLCGVHAVRPFGCRVFFCDETSDEWQRQQYEAHHEQLKRLHEKLGVPYLYIEWREALRAMGVADAAASSSTTG
jgi:Fe-S-cluster containining protein